MSVTELAFMALGLLLGAAGGAAIIAFFGSRLPRREIRVTVTRDAVPRRSETLSQDAFVKSPGAPAPGGPADRRGSDRRDVERRPATPDRAPGPVTAAAIPVAPSGVSSASRNRTIVPTGPGVSLTGARPASAPRPRVSTTVPIGLAAAPAPVGVGIGLSTRDPIWASTAPAGSIAVASGLSPSSTSPASIHADADLELEQARHRRAWGSPLERMLRGEHRAMAEVLDSVAGPDSPRRREWEALLGGLVEALADVAVRESVIDFPMGTAFWDSFTIEQCRRIVGALASMGYAYDGRDDWSEGRVPAYRDLSTALADVGIDPRRIRRWPSSSDIASLFGGARPAPEELLGAAGPDYGVDEVRELVGDRAAELQDLWLAWDAVRPALLEERVVTT